MCTQETYLFWILKIIVFLDYRILLLQYQLHSFFCYALFNLLNRTWFFKVYFKSFQYNYISLYLPIILSLCFTCFSYGILVGFGAGLSYPTGILIINKYFNKKRALAVGLATAGTVVGTIVMPTYIKFLCSSYGYR